MRKAPVHRTLRYSSLAMLAVDRFAVVRWSLQARSADLQGVARTTNYSPKGAPTSSNLN